MLLNFFTVPLIIIIFLLAAQVLLKIKVSVEPCLVSVVVLMRGLCSEHLWIIWWLKHLRSLEL